MGLAEKRAVEEFKTALYPALKSDVEKAAGFAVPLEVKWETLAVADYAQSYNTFFSKVYFEPIIAALKAICVDEMGKSALKSALKKIVICNESENSYPTHFTFSNGVLLLDHVPSSNVDDVESRTSAIQQLLEKNL